MDNIRDAFRGADTMYGVKFAEIYNDAWADFSEKRAYTILEKFASRGSILDVGCGTGNFLRIIERHFERCAGFDISPPMIEIARRNCEKSKLFVGDARSFDLGEKFDLVTGNFDMINHLQSIDEYLSAFRCVLAHLRAGGEFVFDFLTPYERVYIGRDYIIENRKYIKIFRDEEYDADHIEIRMTVLDKPDREELCRVSQIESLYPVERVTAALKEAGFSEITMCNHEYKPLVSAAEPDRVFCRAKA